MNIEPLRDLAVLDGERLDALWEALDLEKLATAGKAQGLEILQAENTQLRGALQRFVTAAKSWHAFHHGSQTVQCDWLCECIPAGERALAGIPDQPGEKP